jgi:hypothetical protein
MWGSGPKHSGKLSMLKRLAKLFSSPAVIFSSVFLIAGAGFGSTRDFGFFLLSIPTLPILFLIALVATVWASFAKVAPRRAAIAWVLICLTPLAYLGAYGMVQRVRFALWAPAHFRALAQSVQKSGVIMGWDNWGMAGSDTSSYLVVDTQDRLGSKGRPDQWTKEIGQTCGIWQVQKMWPKLYVVTTYTDCPYKRFEAAR